MPPFASRGALKASWQISRSLVQTGRRSYSISPEAASKSKPQDIDPSKLTIETTKKPRQLLKNEDLIFGASFTGAT